MNRTLRVLLEPRTLLIGMMILGGAWLAYVLAAAMVPRDKPWREAAEPLLTGAVASFAPTEFPRPTPDVLLENAEGPDRVLSELTGGGVTLVNLWATWCAPCLTELPDLAALEERTGGVRVVPVAMQRAEPKVAETLSAAGLSRGGVLLDPQLQLMGVYGRDLSLPLTVIYDERGYEVGQVAGAVDWTSPEAIRLVEAVRDGAAEF